MGGFGSRVDGRVREQRRWEGMGVGKMGRCASWGNGRCGSKEDDRVWEQGRMEEMGARGAGRVW